MNMCYYYPIEFRLQQNKIYCVIAEIVKIYLIVQDTFEDLCNNVITNVNHL